MFRNKILGGIGIAAGIIIPLFMYIKDKRDKEGEKAAPQPQPAPKPDDVAELKSKMENTELKFTEDIKGQIVNLIDQYRTADPQTADDLLTILILAQKGDEEKALAGLSVIIEKLLEKRIENSNKFIEWFKARVQDTSKNPAFADFLEYARENKIVSQVEYVFVTLLKELGNEDIYKTALKYGKNWQVVLLITAIELILKLSSPEKKG